MLVRNNCTLVIIDVQGKLFESMSGKDLLLQNLIRMIQGAKLLGLPIIWNEQVPEKMGQTVPEIRALLSDLQPIPKSCFSCYGEPAFMNALKKTGRKQVLIAGIESHVCVYQTSRDLITAGYQVEVATDAVSSRTEANKAVGIEKIKSIGGTITSVETALFEMLKTAEDGAFREMLKIVR